MFTVSLFQYYLKNNIVQRQFFKWLDLLQINRIFIFTSSVLWSEICKKCVGGRGSASDPSGGAHDTYPRPPSRLRRGTLPPQTSAPRRLDPRAFDRRLYSAPRFLCLFNWRSFFNPSRATNWKVPAPMIKRLVYTGWAKKVIPLVHYITLYERYHFLAHPVFP